MKRIIYIIFATLLSLNLTTTAQVLDENFWTINGSVRTITSDKDFIYAGGNFNSSSPRIKGNVIISKDDNKLILSNNNEIENSICAVPISDGGWIVGGNFEITDGNTIIKYLAKIDSLGNVDFSWNADVVATVWDIHIIGEDLYIFGNIIRVQNTPMNGMAKLNLLDAKLDLSWQPNKGNDHCFIEKVLVNDDIMYLKGGFNIFDNNPKIRTLAKINYKNGNTDHNFSVQIDRNINDLVLYRDYIFLAGNFRKVNDKDYQNIVLINGLNGNVIGDWNPMPNKEVMSIAIKNDDLYITGEFNTFYNQKCNNLIKVNLKSNTIDTNFKFESFRRVDNLAILDNMLYIGNMYVDPIIDFQYTFCRIDLSSFEIDSNWLFPSSSYISDFVANGNKVLLVGDVESIGGAFCSNLSRFYKTDGLLDKHWMPKIEGEINIILELEDYIYIGGNFESLTNPELKNLARIDKVSGEFDILWNPNIDFKVQDMKFHKEFLYFGGSNLNAGEISIDLLKRLEYNSGLIDLTWNPLVRGDIDCIAIDDDDIYIGGDLFRFQSTNIGYVAKFNMNSLELDKSFDFSNILSEKVIDLEIKHQKVFLISKNLYLFDTQKSYNIFSDSLILDGGWFFSLAFDNNQCILVGSFDHYSNGTYFNSFIKKDLISNRINTRWTINGGRTIHVDERNYYIGSRYGIFKYLNLDNDTLTLSGRVSQSNNGLENIEVSNGYFSTYTDSLGFYSFENLMSDFYTITPISENHIFEPENRRVLVNKYSGNIDFTAKFLRVEDLKFAFTNNIYPNPVNQSLLNMEYSGVDGIGNFTIFDFKGAKIGEYNNLNVTSNSVLNFNLPPNLSKGIYFITSEINGSTQSNKFMIE